MKAEALVAAAMYDLWDGKNEAHDIVELDKFYLMFLVEYANNTFTDYINRVFNPKIAKNQEREIWHVLDEYHVSCDKELPQATAEVSNNDIVLTYSDNVSVEKIEVYVDGVLTQTVTPVSKSSSLTIAKPSNTRVCFKT